MHSFVDIARYNGHPAMQQYQAIVQQIERGDPMHPQEVQEVVDALLEGGFHHQAQMLAGMKVNWDRG
ncbi:hypothetical protein [Sphingobium chungbukense]|uniref:Uncharacterized protein n=1 Tax=Sphingobium chungbukense TaxID=56193 RepID=A0A0M3AS45_9SPHN|nr:hypothetical protein [Sphingobium chungbukense]KKW92703.1 hypothetical protein YP76_07155 [Sphingobium chungbukense]